jgi:oligopeptide transport system substrate-binding protein
VPEPAERSGLRPGNPLRLTLLYNTAEIHKKMALAIANLWKQKLGARVELTNQEWKTYLDSRQSGQFEVIRSSWVADYNDPPPSSALGIGPQRQHGPVRQPGLRQAAGAGGQQSGAHRAGPPVR